LLNKTAIYQQKLKAITFTCARHAGIVWALTTALEQITHACSFAKQPIRNRNQIQRLVSIMITNCIQLVASLPGREERK